MFEGKGPAKTVRHLVLVGGPQTTVFVYAESDTLDLFLRVEDVAGQQLGEDFTKESGGTPLVKCRIERTTELRITVGTKAPGAAGTLCLHVGESPESEQTADAARVARRQLANVVQVVADGHRDQAGARLVTITDRLLRVEGAAHSRAVIAVLGNVGLVSERLGFVKGQRACWTAVVEYGERYLPAEALSLQSARMNLANAIARLGDPGKAKEQLRRVLNVVARTVPTDHIALQRARLNLATVISDLGEIREARELRGAAVEVLSRKRRADDPELLNAREDLASSLLQCGDAIRAKMHRQEVVDIMSRTLPENDLRLQKARLRLAESMRLLGDLRGAEPLVEKVVDAFSRALPRDHIDLQRARQSLALIIGGLGDLARARTLFETVLEVFYRTLPSDHHDLVCAKENLAAIKVGLGDSRGAKKLLEEVLEVRSRKLPSDHPVLQRARQNLAASVLDLGDLGLAKSLLEGVVEVRSRTLPPDHGHLQLARIGLAATLVKLGDLPNAKKLLERVIEAFSPTAVTNHRLLQDARWILAVTKAELGDLRGAKLLLNQVVAALAKSLPANHGDLERVQTSLVDTMAELGELREAMALQKKIIASVSHSFSDDHVVLGIGRSNLAMLMAWSGETDPLPDLLHRMSEGLKNRLRLFSLGAAPREVAARVSQAALETSSVLSLAPVAARGTKRTSERSALSADCFALVETARSVASEGYRLARVPDGPDAGARRLGERFREVRTARAEVTRLARTRTSRDDLLSAIQKRDGAQARLKQALAKLEDSPGLFVEVSVERVAKALSPGELAVGYWRYLKRPVRFPPPPTAVPHYVAFAVRGDGTCTRIDLGPAPVVDDLIARWRAAIATDGSDRQDTVRSLGTPVRKLLLDPVLGASAGARRLLVAPAGSMHLVPLDALPTEEGVVGDQVEILLVQGLHQIATKATPLVDKPSLLVFGGIDYDGLPVATARGQAGAQSIRRSLNVHRGPPREALRGDPARYQPLPNSREEARSIGEIFRSAFREAGALSTRTSRRASKDALMALAPRARFLHVSTHGYFAPDSVPSVQDDQPIDKILGFGRFDSTRTLVRGFSPLVLCGLPLAGANRPGDEGRIDGIITGEELACLDLSGCELAILSACSTNAGELRQGGQGIASLKTALHAAGVRTSITSVWPVRDRPTKELMEEFYRRLWVDGESAPKALWGAKTALRQKLGPSGPYYAARDWAGWVLTTTPSRSP